MAIMYLSKENLLVRENRLAVNLLDLHLTVHKQNIKGHKKPDVSSLVNNVDPDQLASGEAS